MLYAASVAIVFIPYFTCLSLNQCPLIKSTQLSSRDFPQFSKRDCCKTSPGELHSDYAQSESHSKIFIIPLSPSTHHETALITVGIGETESISPAPRETPIDATHKV